MMSTSNHSIILFDGVCNFCNGWVNYAIDRLKEDSTVRFGAIQSEQGAEIIARLNLPEPPPDSIIFVMRDAEPIVDVKAHHREDVLFESEAIIELVRQMRRPWSLLASLRLIPASIRNGIYRWIARNRYSWFGKRDTCRVPTPEERRWFI